MIDRNFPELFISYLSYSRFMYRKIHVFVIAMILASGGIVAAIPLTNTAFATCGLGSQDIHCSGQSPLGPNTAGNFKCDIAANQCAFSGNVPIGGGHCTGTLVGPTACVGQIIGP